MASEPTYLADLQTLLALLRDGEKGFRDMAELVDSSPCRLFLLEEGFVRATYAAELGRELHWLTGERPDLSGTTLGKLHRRWIELKATFGVSSSSILDNLGECERVAVLAYEALLDPQQALPETLRLLLERQASHVRHCLPTLLELCARTPEKGESL